MSQLVGNYERIKQAIFAVKSSYDLQQHIGLLAVSKKKPAEMIRELYNAGHRYFGENYAQEMTQKANDLSDLDIKWSFIGQLQSNKINKIVEHASEIQALASIKHALLIEKAAIRFDKAPFPVFINVNVGEEESKGGINLLQLDNLYTQITSQFPGLKVMGLMAIPPATFTDESDKEPPEPYLKLRRAANQIGSAQLSLGMSRDLKIALRAGSNIVRIGTDIFGTRD